MMRRIWFAGMLACLAIGGCQIDPRDLHVVESGLQPGDGSAGGLLVQPSSIAYGPVTLAFAASARVLVENAGTETLDAPVISLAGDGASAFILTQNDCTAALPRGAYCVVAVAFRPRDPSAREATLTITGSDRSFDIPLSGSGLEPGGLLLQAAPGSEALFGDVPLQGEQESTLQLSNPGDTSSGPVELISNNAAFRLLASQGSECASSGAQLAGGQSCNFRVRFAPTLRGVTDATITARSTASGSVSLGVSGRAVAPARLLVEPARLEFGDVVVAGAGVLDLAISNVGDEPLPPVTASVSGEAASDFRVSTNGCSQPLPSQGTCSISVSFSPRATGPHGAVLRLDAGRGGSLGIDLSGAGLFAGNLLVAAAGDGDFGSVALGNESPQALRISSTSNEASGPLTLAINSADFSIVPPVGPECVSDVTNLAGGASCDIHVRFVPTQRGQRNATLTVSSRVGGAALNLSGVALAPAEIRADGAVDFGSISQGGTTLRSVTVTNAGDERAASLSARVSGLDASSFSVQSNGCMAGLDAQGSCVISLLFTPTATGSQLAVLTLDGAPGNTRDVTLSGTGLAPALSGGNGSGNLAPNLSIVATEGTNFGSVEIGASAARSFTLRNTGDIGAGTLLGFTIGGTFSLAPPVGAECQSGVTLLDGGASCDFRVLFMPPGPGSATATITANTTSGGSASLTIAGSGDIGAPPVLTEAPVLTGSNFRLTFLNPVPVNGQGTETLEWIVHNTGGSATEAIVFKSTNPLEVPAIGNSCVGALEAGAECSLSFLLTPIALGQRTAVMTVSAGALSTVVTIVGTGI
jgi:centrosomal CEP192-like protein